MRLAHLPSNKLHVLRGKAAENQTRSAERTIIISKTGIDANTWETSRLQISATVLLFPHDEVKQQF